MKEIAQDTHRRNFIGPARRHSQYDARRGVSHNSREHIVEIPYHRMDHRQPNLSQCCPPHLSEEN